MHEDKYYDYITKYLMQLKSDGTAPDLDISNKYIDPYLDIIIRSFSFTASILDENINSSFSKLQDNVMKTLFNVLYMIKPSTAVCQLEGETSHVKSGTKINVIDEDTYVYSSCFDINVIEVSSKSYCISAKDMRIPNTTESQYVRIDIYNTSNDYDLSRMLMMKDISIFIKGIKNLMSVFQVNKNRIMLYVIDNKRLLECGYLEFNININLFYGIESSDYLTYLASYIRNDNVSNFMNLHIYDNIDIPDNFVSFYIPCSAFIEHDNFILFNSVLITNLFLENSSSVAFDESIYKQVYLQYVTRHTNMIVDIKNCIATAKEDGRNYHIHGISRFSNNAKILTGVRWYLNCGFDIEKKYITHMGLHIPDKKMEYDLINKYVYSFKALCTNNVNKTISFKESNVDHLSVNDISIITKPTHTFFPNRDNKVASSLLYAAHFYSFYNDNNFFQRVMRSLNGIYYYVANDSLKNIYDIWIKDIKIDKISKQALVSGEFLSNIMVYKIIVFIDSKYNYSHGDILSLICYFCKGSPVNIYVIVEFVDYFDKNIIYTYEQSYIL